MLDPLIAAQSMKAKDDEISRLNAENRTLRNVGVTQGAEIERLRAALATLKTLGEEGMKPDYKEWITFHEKVAQIATEALQ